MKNICIAGSLLVFLIACSPDPVGLITGPEDIVAPESIIIMPQKVRYEQFESFDPQNDLLVYHRNTADGLTFLIPDDQLVITVYVNPDDPITITPLPESRIFHFTGKYVVVVHYQSLSDQYTIHVNPPAADTVEGEQ
jgi:hypothetical protein